MKCFDWDENITRGMMHQTTTSNLTYDLFLSYN